LKFPRATPKIERHCEEVIMPLSWFKVPRGTSDKLKQCRGNDMSNGKFEHCVKQIVSNHGRVVEFRHNGQGANSHVKIDWPNDEAKAQIERDLDATEVRDPDA
jgi:hypothetical protein